jgi:transcriptional regulator with GAF, ATPase, and Fis domain
MAENETIRNITIRYLHEEAPVFFLTLNRHGTILDANQYALKLVGEDIRAKSIKEILVDFTDSIDLAGLLKDAEKPHLLNVNTFTGLPQTLYFRFFPLGDEIIALGNPDVLEVEELRSELVSLNNELNNLTRELHKKHAELEKLNTELEGRVADRTAELSRSNAALRGEIEERKRAEEALRKAYNEIESLKERLQEENVYLQEEIRTEHNFSEIIGQSDALKYVLFRVEQVAPTDATVLILGETGTGKELVARAIHSASSRSERPLVKVNCATLPSNLIESELFGHERGAFTGARERLVGRFEISNGSTIFLDEIGELLPELQSKLLRVLQDGEFERLGSTRTIKVDVRIIAATNRNLEEEIQGGRFREDLWYRLNVFPITIPPLRQRAEDIPLLIQAFVQKFRKKLGKPITTIPDGTLQALRQYRWPGNVRELENVIERAMIVSPGPALRLADRLDTAQVQDPAKQGGRSLDEIERDHIVRTLEETDWRIEGENGAAVALGINPSTLRGRMRKLGIRRPRGLG